VLLNSVCHPYSEGLLEKRFQAVFSTTECMCEIWKLWRLVTVLGADPFIRTARLLVTENRSCVMAMGGMWFAAIFRCVIKYSSFPLVCMHVIGYECCALWPEKSNLAAIHLWIVRRGTWNQELNLQYRCIYFKRASLILKRLHLGLWDCITIVLEPIPTAYSINISKEYMCLCISCHCCLFLASSVFFYTVLV
jgi:hypothetical protein